MCRMRQESLREFISRNHFLSHLPITHKLRVFLCCKGQKIEKSKQSGILVDTPMREAIRKHHISFKIAISGLVWAFTTQPNFRVHLTLSVLAIGFGVYLGISRIEMVIIFFTILLGLTAEMINTSIESMTDLITKEWRQEAKVAKDVAAGMMLLTAIGATIVAAIIFFPYLTALLLR